MGIKGELMNFGGGSGWRFVEEGARVVLTDIDDERGEKTAADISEAGGDAVYMHHDVSCEQDWDRVIAATLTPPREARRIDKQRRRWRRRIRDHL